MAYSRKPGARIARQMLTAFILFGLPSAMAGQDSGKIKSLMHSFLAEYVKLSPYLKSEQALATPEGKTAVAQSLDNLSQRLKPESPREFKVNPGFRISYSLLADHVAKTKIVFERGETEHTRMRLASLGNVCANCHMQAPNISHFSAFSFITDRKTDTSYESANFLFTIRRYEDASQVLDRLIRTYPNANMTSDELNEAYRHKLAILARVFRDPSRAIKSLSEDAKNAKLPADTKANLQVWSESFKKWQDDKVDPAKLKTPELIAYVEKLLPEPMGRNIAPSYPALINLLRASGLLYERLFTEAKGETAQELLYYLARCERSLSGSYWYSLSEIYLKECIMAYPKQKFSQRCYEAYQDGMRERYPHPPEFVEESIKALKDYL